MNRRPAMILFLATILLAAIANAQESPAPAPTTQPALPSEGPAEAAPERAPEAASPDTSSQEASPTEPDGGADSGADDPIAERPRAVAQFTTGVENREPIDHVTFVENDAPKVFFFSELRGLEGQTILHRWIYDGQVQAEVRFDVQGPRWRVWSSKKLLPDSIGDWTVEIVLDSGEVIASESFTYSAPRA